MPAEPRRLPRYREDFPTRVENDQYIKRREFARLLTIGSGLLVAANGVIAAVGQWLRKPASADEGVFIAKASSIATGASTMFRYPTDRDPCILVRTHSGVLRAYSQVCTHLSCAVIHRSEEDDLFCPCHHGVFSVSEGRPIAGPPTRRLPRIWLEQRGDDVYAVGRDT